MIEEIYRGETEEYRIAADDDEVRALHVPSGVEVTTRASGNVRTDIRRAVDLIRQSKEFRRHLRRVRKLTINPR